MDPKRIAVVTGGNRGIGLEIYRQLAKLRLHVVLTARDEDKGGRACRKLADSGLDVVFHPLDVEVATFRRTLETNLTVALQLS